jgi:hypothetical protein
MTNNPMHLTKAASCTDCGFTTNDMGLLAHHSCDVQEQGGRCEDFPCCGHEAGDCNGLLYGSDEAIKSDPHLLCDHEAGVCDLYEREIEEAEDEAEAEADRRETEHYTYLREMGVEA